MPVRRPAGLLAEFGTADELVHAATAARTAGLTRMEAYAPYPLPEAAWALGYRRPAVPAIMFVGGLIGGAAAYFMQYWTMAIDFPLNVGGRPLDSWPSFIPITFELTVLTSALCGLLGLLFLCRLPRYHHPLFGVGRFARATSDGFFLFVDATDPRYDLAGTHGLLTGLGPRAVEEVPG